MHSKYKAEESLFAGIGQPLGSVAGGDMQLHRSGDHRRAWCMWLDTNSVRRANAVMFDIDGNSIKCFCDRTCGVEDIFADQAGDLVGL